MNWLQIVLVSYFILSITNLFDKIFLSKVITDSTVYMLWVNILSIAGAVLIAGFLMISQYTGGVLTQFGALTMMPPMLIFISILIGIIFTVAIYFLYSGLQSGEASRVIPLIGGSMPVFTLLLTFWYEPLGGNALFAFVILVAGTVLISLMPRQKNAAGSAVRGSVMKALAASLSFALLFVLTQYLFREQGFVNGILWPRIGSLLSIVAILFHPAVRRKLQSSVSGISFKYKSLWLTNQSFSAVGFLGQQFAISLPGVSVALVTALLGVQYSFLLIFATLLSFFRPHILREQVKPAIIVQKVVAIILIAIGLYLIAR